MRVELVIQELLYKKNFITIPNFGSLVSQYQPARIIKSESVKFIPPHKIIAFNSSISQNDTTLAQTIASNYSLSIEQAELEIEQFVLNVTTILEEKRQYQIQGLGIFYFDAENTVEFQSDKSINYLTQTFGLSDFSVQVIPQQDVLDKAIKRHEQETDPIRRRIFKSLFIAIPIIFALILIPNILHLQQSAGLFNWFEDTEVFVDLTEPNKPIPEQSSAYFNTPEPSNAAYDTPLEINTPPVKEVEHIEIEETPIVVETVANYYIIVGSFSTEWKAKSFANKLNEQSFNAGVLTKQDKIRVYASLHESRNEALESLNEIRQKEGFESAWLFTQE